MILFVRAHGKARSAHLGRSVHPYYIGVHPINQTSNGYWVGMYPINQTFTIHFIEYLNGGAEILL
jgi:hypothetical protein